jgi:uncharacterized protein (DUF1800 family)
LVGPGDYTNYTEQDVSEIAKVLTGWRVAQLSAASQAATFTSTRHTTGQKKLSPRFNNAVIAENGANEYKDMIDVIFKQDECARFITRKLYRWFVNYDIPNDVETNIIKPLAVILKNNNYEIAPALKILLKSQHFFETTAYMIKSPIDLMMSATRGLGIKPPQGNVEKEYDGKIFMT